MILKPEKRAKLIFLFYLITFVLGDSFGCISWENSFLSFKNITNSTIQIDVWAAGRRGWFGITFQDDNNFTLPVTLIAIAYLPNNSYFLDQHNNLTQLLTDWKITWDESTFPIIDNQIHFTIQVPYTLISSSRYIGFARNYYDTPTIGKNITIHDQFGLKLNPLVDTGDEFEILWCSETYLGLPGRIGAYHFGIYIPLMIFYLIIFILMVWFRDYEPLKSRGMSPYIALFCISIDLTLEFINITGFTYEELYSFECFTTGYILYLLSILMCVIPIQYFLRYISLVNINIQKNEIIKGNSDEKLPFWVFILKYMNHGAVTGVFYLTFIVFYYTIAIITFSSYNWKCGSGVSQTMRYIEYTLLIIVLITTLLSQIFDTIMNFKLLIYCKFRKFFIDYDHYYYRLEKMTVFFALIFGTLWVFAPVPSLIKILFNELLFFVAIFLFCVFIVFTTIIKYIQEKCVKRDQDGFLERIWNDDEALALFQEYCQNEFSLENFYFKSQVNKYKLLNTEEARKKMANEMYAIFLTNSSNFEINCRQENIKKIKEKMILEKFPENLFESIENEVNVNLNDTLFRFVNTNKFYSLKKKQSLLGVKKF